MHNYPWQNRKADYPGLLGAFLASWIFHCLLIAILATTTIYYPPVNDISERFDFNFIWASLGPGAEEQADSTLTIVAKPLPGSPQADPGRVEAASGDTEEIEEPVSADDSRLARDSIVFTTIRPEKPKTDKVLKQKSMEIVGKVLPIKEAQKSIISPPLITPEAVTPPTKSAHDEARENEKIAENEREYDLAESSKALAEPESERLEADKEKLMRFQAERDAALREKIEEESRAAESARRVELDRLAREKISRERLAAEQRAREQAAEEKSRIERFLRTKAENEQRVRADLARARVAEEKAAKAKAELARPAQGPNRIMQAEAAKQVVGEASGGPGNIEGNGISSTKAGQASVSAGSAVADANQSQKHAEAEGVTLPPIKGDIKLTVHSEDDLKIKVLFIDYPKAKHGRPISRNEAKALQKLTPVVVRSSKTTLEVVLERAREGIYVFMVAQVGAKVAEGRFSLKLFNTHVKSLPGRKISAETEICRLMMPEGILWDDETAFSGNIEDSDSVTKFNADTGLVWKEYRK